MKNREMKRYAEGNLKKGHLIRLKWGLKECWVIGATSERMRNACRKMKRKVFQTQASAGTDSIFLKGTFEGF